MKLITNHNIICEKNNIPITFDIFIKNKKLILICPSPNNISGVSNLFALVNNNKLNLHNFFIKDCNSESYRIYIFDCNFEEKQITVKINYDNYTKEFILDNEICEMKYDLTITTCFKDDYKKFPMWYDYYIKQGVEHFYMYYNGKLTDDIKNTLNKPNVTLHEWNYPYWSPFGGRLHFAQLGQIQHALYKYGKDNSDYMIFCDLDEFLYLKENIKLIDKLKSEKPDQIAFKNLWAKLIEDYIPNTLPEKFYIDKRNKLCPGRRKGICKTCKINSSSVHEAECQTNMFLDDDIKKYPDITSKTNRIRHCDIKKSLEGIMFHFKTSKEYQMGDSDSFSSLIYPDHNPFNEDYLK